MIKFLIVGGVNFIFTLVLFYMCVSIASINPIFSIAIVSIAGLILTYYLNFTWVFLPEKKINFQNNLLRYSVASGASIIINMILLHILLVNSKISAFCAQLYIIPIIVAFNFSTAKFWSLRR
jgi:putative flippase GtrA